MKSINNRGGGEKELEGRFHGILDVLYGAYPDEPLEDVPES